MRRVDLLAVALCATVWMGAFAEAQVLREVRGPAELPPPGYSLGQYVDSRGCVFVRAGYGGTLTWVPRVGNNRRPLCNQKATVEKVVPDVAAAAPAPHVVTPAPAPAAPTVVATAPTPRLKPGAAAPMPTVAVTASALPPRMGTVRSSIPAETYLPARVAVAAPPAARPAPVQAAAPKPQAGRARVQLVNAASECPDEATGPMRRLSDGRSVRLCGATASGTPVYLVQRPEPVARPVLAAPMPAAVARPAQPVARPVGQPVRQPGAQAAAACPGLKQVNPLYLVNDGRLVVRCEGARGGKAVYLVVGRAPASGATSGPIPPGYKLAWNDDRLNPTRGGRTLAGEQAMRLVWTDETPRRLIDELSGKDVTMAHANLVYPYTSYAAQAAAEVSPVVTPAQLRTARAVASAENGGRRVSTMSAKAVPSALAGKRYVQVGSFGVPENAQGASDRLRAAGLPVAVTRSQRGGKIMQTVLAGPFDQAEDLARALAVARDAGFADAFAKN